ncbi:MAG: glycosyltransferase [Halodesulfurarchaeum sp.]|nr:glycosyltransferase [Halodesulfurarchaeum sp.]
MTDTIAIAHKDYDCRGGGEVFCRRLAEYLDCPMFVGRRNLTNEPDNSAIDITEIPLSRPEQWMIDRGGLTRTAAYMLRWPAAADQLSQFDTIITSGNEPLWWVPDDDQTVIAYTHSTPRYMYDLFNEKTDFQSLTGRLATVFYNAQRVLYETNVNRPDVWVANSELVARRIERYWNIDESQIEVVHPPVDTHEFSPEAAETDDYYLYLGRLAGAKCVDQVVAAFDELDAELVIAGTGSERERLEAMAGESVRFTGFVSEERKRELYAGARALIFPAQNEDFGMVPIEAMAAGTPVLGVRDGFTRFQVQPGECGLLWERGELAETVRAFERDGVTWSETEIATYAATNWSIGRFESEMQAVIDEATETTAVEVDLETPARGFECPIPQSAATDGGTE